MQPNPLFRYSSWIGHLTFAVLAVLAICFFKERMLTLDATYQSFAIIKRGWFAIQANRFGAAMTQVFPLLALKLKLPFPILLTLYSLGFVIVHWAMFAICDSWLKVKQLGLAIVFFNIFMVNDTFYWAQNEIIQAVSLNLVFWALLIRLGKWQNIRWYHYLILVFLLVTLAFFHPLVVFPFVFMVGYFLLDSLEKKQVTIQRSFNLAALAIFCASLGLKYLAYPNPYDTMTTGRFSMKNIATFFSGPFTTSGFHRFMDHLPTDFYLLPIALAAITIFYIRKKLTLKLLYTWASVIGLVLIVMISYIEGGHWFHVESQYLPVSIFVIVPLVWEVLPNFSSSKAGLRWTVAALILVISIRIADIALTSSFYSSRVAYIDETLQKTWPLKGKKFIMSKELADEELLLQPWCFAYETLYYSALQSPDSTRTIAILEVIDTSKWIFKAPKTFIAPNITYLYSELPPNYFNFTDTTSTYQLIQ